MIDEAQVRQLGEAWFTELTELVNCVDAGAGGHTVSDFPLATVSQTEIEALETEHAGAGGLAAVLPLSPLQHGLAFHADYGGTDVYTAQFVLDLTGPLDAALLRESIRKLLIRHENLRAGFRQNTDGTTYQVITGTTKIPFTEVDVSNSAAPEDEAKRVAEEERARPFDLTQPPLIRFVLIAAAPDHHRLVLTNHHILLDGWSMPLLLDELFRLYRNAADISVLAPLSPYRQYLTWIAAADRADAETAWRHALDRADPTLVAPPQQQAMVQVPQSIRMNMGESFTRELGERAKEWGVTASTVVQAAWGVLLA
ncbi:condensation domain-containing protein, partial [Rhodococcus erythropolis]|nr:condensation domain-containing protein [Rhodococcus erythropolis]